MKHTIIIISGILTIVMLVGLVFILQLPGKVKQVTPLVSYQQTGNFDYVINLKPSALYGDFIPAVSSYPSAVINTVNFTFNYSNPEPTDHEITVEALLTNPGIWQKTMTIIPTTKNHGDFQVDFSLDIPQISQTFNNIEEATQITTTAQRRIELNIVVQSDHGRFVQTLPIDLTESIIKINNDLVRQDIAGTGTLEYTVNLTDPSLFDTAVLKPAVIELDTPAMISPGQPALAKLCDNMEVNFNYKFTSDKAVSNINTTVDIVAIIKAPNLWSKTFPLLGKTINNGVVQASFPVNLADYIALINSVISESSVTGESYNIVLQTYIQTVADSQYGKINEVFQPALNGTIKGNVLNWDKELVTTQTGSITESQSVPNHGRNTNLIIFGVLAALFAAVFIYSILRFARSKPTPVSKLEVETALIDKKYGQRIASATGKIPELSLQVVNLESIADLMKIADELGKPVVQQSAEEVTYFVLDGENRYQYQLPSSDNDSDSTVNAT